MNQGTHLAPDSNRTHKSGSDELVRYRNELEGCLGQTFDEMQKIWSNENISYVTYRRTTGLGVYVDLETAMTATLYYNHQPE